jgi:hypothetical protein
VAKTSKTTTTGGDITLAVRAAPASGHPTAPARLTSNLTSHVSERDRAFERDHVFHLALPTPNPKTPFVRPT